MSENNVKTILVLGTGSVDTLQFIKLFGTYLQFDNYEDSTEWPLNCKTEEVDDIRSSAMLIGSKKFNFILAPVFRYASQQVLSIILHFINKKKVTAIIFLVKLTQEYDEGIWKYKTSLLSELKQFAEKNILYLMMANNDSYKHEQFILNSFRKERGIFYFQEDLFYASKENWQENVEVSKSIYNYIVGDKNTNGLQDYFIQSVMSVASTLKLADDLLEFLIQIYICAEYCKLSYVNRSITYYKFYINKKKGNGTTCYGNNCVRWINHGGDLNLKMKIPKLCHGPCKCTEPDADVGNCKMFETSNKTCLHCDCKGDVHSKNYFEICTENVRSFSDNLKNEKEIAMKLLITFFIYKKQNQEVYNYENIFLRLLDMHDTKHQTVFGNFQIEFNEKLQSFDKSNPITFENISICLKDLYKITQFATVMPEVIEEIFPEDFHLEVVKQQVDKQELNNDTQETCEMPKINDEKQEIHMLKHEITEMKQLLRDVLK